MGDVEELDGESEWLDEPLLNWKTRDCELVELSVLLRGVSLLFDLLLSKPKKPFRLPERCPLPVIAPGEFVSWPLALLVGLSAIVVQHRAKASSEWWSACHSGAIH